MSRTRVVAVLMLVAAVAAALWLWQWPSARPALDCPSGQVGLDEHGVARCAPGRALPAGQAHTLGHQSDLNLATEDELALLPGVSAQLAHLLIVERTRTGGFSTWEQVDAIEGIGPQRLTLLQTEFTLDAGSFR